MRRETDKTENYGTEQSTGIQKYSKKGTHCLALKKVPSKVPVKWGLEEE